MEPKSESSGLILAPPPSGSSGALRLPPAREFPPVDEHLVKPETREEMVRGRRVLAMPANPEHGDRHFKLDYVLAAHVKDDYVGSTDLLTRSAESSNFATDSCVRRKGVDPATGRRYLEELSFEIVNEQSVRDIRERAEDLTARGVRRVVAIFVKKGEVCEWSAVKGGWKMLDPEGTFSDPVLARPVRVKDLIDAAGADNAVARALLDKDNPVLVDVLAGAKTESLKQGLRMGIEAACDLLGIELDGARRTSLSELDAVGLEALLARIRAERRWS